MDEVDLRCPISLELMEDPVIALDGHTYEREAIEKWFECSNSSPLTNEKLDSKVWGLRFRVELGFRFE
jgi:hypothetical protein